MSSIAWSIFYFVFAWSVGCLNTTHLHFGCLPTAYQHVCLSVHNIMYPVQHMVYDVIEGTCEQLVGEADACRLTHSIVQNLEEQGVLDLGQREPPSFRLHFGEMPAGFMF
eukprot:m.81852 g.81852  ORF g.81852 m.81852 type:complete len:110 (-) comp12657_c0_seq5:3147-3476(-)